MKREVSPTPPKEAGHLPPGHPRPVPLGRGETRGDFDFPRTPLKRHKGEGLRPLPFGFPTPKEERQRKEKQLAIL